MFTFQEETMIENFIIRRAKLGCGFNYEQLRSFMREILNKQVLADSTRVTGYENSNHTPTMDYVYRFVRRRSLSLRSTMELDNKRASITPEQISRWFKHVKEEVLSLPGMEDAIRDARIIFNVVCVFLDYCRSAKKND